MPKLYFTAAHHVSSGGSGEGRAAQTCFSLAFPSTILPRAIIPNRIARNIVPLTRKLGLLTSLLDNFANVPAPGYKEKEKGNFHVRFSGEGTAVTPFPYPAVF
jgi:hypothetical protein